MNILLIDDDTRIATALKQALAGTHVIDHAARGLTGLDLARHADYDIVLLDLSLPDLNGQEVCQRLRSDGLLSPILILSGDAAVLHKISLLDAGANDYLTKPFSLGELKARLRVLGRQVSTSRPTSLLLHVGDVTLDNLTHSVVRNGTIIPLRRKEYSLLECLMQNAGNVVTRQTLMRYAWHDDQDPWTNTIDVHIKYLRDKLDRPFDNPVIKTVHGIGYKMIAEAAVGAPPNFHRRPPPGRTAQPKEGYAVH